jgi:hypothetical protein
MHRSTHTTHTHAHTHICMVNMQTLHIFDIKHINIYVYVYMHTYVHLYIHAEDDEYI